MRCAEARTRLLEAELRDLRAGGDEALAEHVAGCAACAATVSELRAFEEDLDSVLGGAPAVDAAEIVRRAHSPERAERWRGGSAARRAWRPRTWVSLAAAATVAAWMLWPRPHRPLPGEPFSAPRLGPPAVEAPAGRDVAILPTSNPDITVLWFF